MDKVECETHIFHRDGRVYCKRYKRYTGSYVNGYIHFSYQGRKQRVHRVIYEKFKGTIPAGFEINHINGKRDDNRIENLEPVSKKHNGQHRGSNKTNTSGYKNIFWYKASGKWNVKINGTHYGYFTDIQQAITARDTAIENLNQQGHRFIVEYPE
jgi:hypothetical protein